MDLQTLIVIFVVLVAGGFLFARALKKARKSGDCGPDCKCGK